MKQVKLSDYFNPFKQAELRDFEKRYFDGEIGESILSAKND